jgi:protein tyrosine phosphatase (PTP) superfamily phosphohydrolase (DUF442 family)
VLICAIVLPLLGCSGGDTHESAKSTRPGGPESADDEPAREPAPEPTATARLLPEGLTEADYPHLHSLLKVTGRIYAGGEPKDEEAFGDLARLGVKTVVSVDGARPNVEAAQRHGLRYVHIPIGYDGISDEACKSLARLVKDADAPFYIHCHHGVHRGPAAAAIACIADGAADGKSALAILEKAKTSKGYAGLWRDVEAYIPPSADEILPELVAIAEVGSLAAAMAQIDRASDNLKLCMAADWLAPPGHPDIASVQEALLLKEGFRETVRQLREANDYDEQFAAWMREAEVSAEALEAALSGQDKAAASQAMTTVQGACKRCHTEYRD